MSELSPLQGNPIEDAIASARLASTLAAFEISARAMELRKRKSNLSDGEKAAAWIAPFVLGPFALAFPSTQRQIGNMVLDWRANHLDSRAATYLPPD